MNHPCGDPALSAPRPGAIRGDFIRERFIHECGTNRQPRTEDTSSSCCPFMQSYTNRQIAFEDSPV